jgi:DNA mismatch endonuclease (patch repair protein)
MEKLLKATLPTGDFPDVPPVRSRTMAAIKGKHNLSTDIQFRMALVRAGVKGWLTHPNLPGKPDVYFPKSKLAVFLDGCFWHGCKRCGHIPKTNSLFWATKIERNKARDRKNARLLRKQGIHVVRAWEHSLKNKRHLINILQGIQDIILETKLSSINNDESAENKTTSKRQGRFQ